MSEGWPYVTLPAKLVDAVVWTLVRLAGSHPELRVLTERLKQERRETRIVRNV